MVEHRNRLSRKHWRSWWPVLAIAVMAIAACTSHTPTASFDPRHCMEVIPETVDGLTVVEGPRTKASIIRDMVPVVCNGHVRFDRMLATDPDLKAGSGRKLSVFSGQLSALGRDCGSNTE